VLTRKLYFAEGSVRRGRCLESILLIPIHAGLSWSSAPQPVQGGDPRLPRRAVAGHAHKPTESPPDAVPWPAPGHPARREAGPEQGPAPTEQGALATLPAMTNGWAEASGSNGSLGKQGRHPRAMAPSTCFGPN